MSNYAAVFFVTRKDYQPMEKSEQAKLLSMVSAWCRKRNVTNDEGGSVLPSVFNQNDDKNSFGMMIYQSVTFSFLSEKEKFDKVYNDREQFAKLEALIETQSPGTYTFKFDYVTFAHP